MLNQKVLADAQKVAFGNIIQEHYKAHNPVGVSFKGESRRPAPQAVDGNEAKDAKTYASELDGPKSRGEFSMRKDHRWAEH